MQSPHDQDIADIRSKLRADMAARRAALGAPARIAAAEGVMRSLEQLPEFMVDPDIAGYWAVRGEVPLNLAVARLSSRGQHYFLPVLDDSAPRTLRFAEFRAGAALAPNRFGIPEPRDTAIVSAEQLDVVLLPLLAFDARGNRLGTGGGWYDTTFAFLREQARPARPLLVGVGYAFQQVDALPPESWDIPLDCIATENALIDCTASERP
ncbi:MAG TPA: 5-formyltetrahydrofolate cyclo-ligase [Rhodanobacteraceae bacterium]|nr:5-formyltetrahydrofolate cyclo-ligase [Rhodanobacteraceae bacterium]